MPSWSCRVRRCRSSKRSGSSSSMWPATMPPEQQPAEAGRRGDGQVRAPERHPPRRRDGPRVEHLQLGQDHRLRLLGFRCTGRSSERTAVASSTMCSGSAFGVSTRSASAPARATTPSHQPGSVPNGALAPAAARAPATMARVAPLSSGSLLQLVGRHEQLAHRLEARRPADGEGGAGRGEGGHDLVDPLLVDGLDDQLVAVEAVRDGVGATARRAARRSCSSSHSDRS